MSTSRVRCVAVDVSIAGRYMVRNGGGGRAVARSGIYDCRTPSCGSFGAVYSDAMCLWHRVCSASAVCGRDWVDVGSRERQKLWWWRQALPLARSGMTATHLSVVRLERSILMPCACGIESASWARCMTATGSMMGPESVTKWRSRGTISCSALAFSPLTLCHHMVALYVYR